MRRTAATVPRYLAGLPEERRRALAAVRKVIRANLPEGYVETMNRGMICYEVPLAVFPETYNGKPLMYAALANQKNHMAVHLSALYCVAGALATFRKNWKRDRLDMGAACVRFRTLDDLDLDAVGKSIAATPLARFVAASRR